MTVRLYVEGGGEGKDQRSRCREGFSKLIEKAGFGGRMPHIVAGGARSSAFDMFRTAMRAGDPDNAPMLLVDSEEPVQRLGDAWAHLSARDGWDRPPGVADDQAQLMVTCMESWILADHGTLVAFFGPEFRRNALLPVVDLEARSRQEVQDSLERATSPCGRDRQYRKGRRSFRVLAELDPNVLRQHLPHFRRFIEALNDRL